MSLDQTPQQTTPAAPIQQTPAADPVNVISGNTTPQTSSMNTTVSSNAPTQPSASSSMGVSSNDAQAQIIAQQQAQIEALMQQNQSLNAQVVSMVQNGAQLSSAQPQTKPLAEPYQPSTPTQVQQMAQLGAQPDPLGTFNPPSLSNQEDYSLEALANEIGKDRPTH